MKKIITRFEQDPSLDCIEINVRSDRRDEQVNAIFRTIADAANRTLSVLDAKNSVVVVAEKDIISITADGKQPRVITSVGNFFSAQPLVNLEKLIDPERFLRISRYELINIDKVRKFDFSLSGILRIELEGGIETWASRRCIPTIRKRLAEGKGQI